MIFLKHYLKVNSHFVSTEHDKLHFCNEFQLISTI